MEMSEEKSLKTQRKVAYRESSLHMNYLYQLATCTLAQNPENTNLVRFYLQTMQSIAKKLVLRIDPSIKRTLCKKCYMLLVPGITATVRIKSKKSRQRHTVVQCLECKALKRFNSNSDYKLWTEQNEAWVVKKNPEKVETPSSTTSKKDKTLSKGMEAEKSMPLSTDEGPSSSGNMASTVGKNIAAERTPVEQVETPCTSTPHRKDENNEVSSSSTNDNEIASTPRGNEESSRSSSMDTG
ncbi:ribonuclease P protein subunit p21-like [Lineus longissimus]|uniref:ribonuclease P protein subunit p21-like n=1 Tax=Lineus longissimus TaxID=88925 RepID=UPI002B4F2BEB